MIAALPMYFPPAGAVEAFWQALASVLRDSGDQSLQWQVPEHLTWPTDYHAHWQSDDILISQTCGYPLCTELSGKVQVLGAFAYDVPGADGVLCTSQLICRADDARQTLAEFLGCTLAFNATNSQSGYNALRAEVATYSAARPFFGKTVAVGGHGKAIEAVRTGAAEMASIDCVTLALWQRANPALASQIRVFGRTKHYPGLPLITGLSTPTAAVDALRRGLAAMAAKAQFAAARAPLLICGFTPLEHDDYAVCLEMRALAEGVGLESL